MMQWFGSEFQVLTNAHKNVTPAKGLRRLLTIIFKVNSVCDIGILSFDVIRYTERRPIHIMAFAFGINSKNTFWSGTMKVWIYQLSWLLFTLQTGDMTVVNPLFSDQEVGGSDQDGNGNKSGASGQGSPVMPRHPHKE